MTQMRTELAHVVAGALREVERDAVLLTKRIVGGELQTEGLLAVLPALRVATMDHNLHVSVPAPGNESVINGPKNRVN